MRYLLATSETKVRWYALELMADKRTERTWRAESARLLK
jgi:hypothetical protein